MSQPRKQHYLPQFYLQGFSLDGRGIYQLEKKTGKHYGCQIKDVAAIKDFHNLDFAGVEDPFALEKRLASLESNLAVHLAEFLRDGVSNSAARQYTLQLLSLMRLRVPAYKEHIEASHKSRLHKIVESMAREEKLPSPPLGSEHLLKPENLKIGILNWKTMELIFNSASDEKVLSDLYSMRASVLSAPPGMSFVTSDQPVALYHPKADEMPYGIGPNVPRVEISLPLTSRKLLKLDHSRGQHLSRVAKPFEVEELNRRTIAMATTYIFAAYPPQHFVRLAEETRSIKSGFVFDDLNLQGRLVQLLRFIAIGPRANLKSTNYRVPSPPPSTLLD